MSLAKTAQQTLAFGRKAGEALLALLCYLLFLCLVYWVAEYIGRDKGQATPDPAHRNESPALPGPAEY